MYQIAFHRCENLKIRFPTKWSNYGIVHGLQLVRPEMMPLISTFFVPIDGRKKVLIADQITIFYALPSFYTNTVENTQFLAGARAFSGHFDFGSISEKIKIRWKFKSDFFFSNFSLIGPWELIFSIGPRVLK